MRILTVCTCAIAVEQTESKYVSLLRDKIYPHKYRHKICKYKLSYVSECATFSAIFVCGILI